MHIVEQKLVVKDWPLKKPGDEMFFGYLVALGVFPGGDWDGDSIFSYADFAYGDSYARFLLPNDDGLLEQLKKYLADALEILAASGSIEVKLWIKLTENGYEVDLP